MRGFLVALAAAAAAIAVSGCGAAVTPLEPGTLASRPLARTAKEQTQEDLKAAGLAVVVGRGAVLYHGRGFPGRVFFAAVEGGGGEDFVLGPQSTQHRMSRAVLLWPARVRAGAYRIVGMEGGNPKQKLTIGLNRPEAAKTLLRSGLPPDLVLAPGDVAHLGQIRGVAERGRKPYLELLSTEADLEEATEALAWAFPKIAAEPERGRLSCALCLISKLRSQLDRAPADR
ncbi:MAG: hypothetical protein AAFR16_07595 [Pseudomonadota bacterium]